MKRLVIAALVTLSFFNHSATTIAQEEARAAWQVTHFDVSANMLQAERVLSATAVLTANNVGRGAGATFTFRIHPKATVKAVTVGGATANFRAVPETSGGLQRLTVTLPSSAQPGANIAVNINYSIPIESNSGLTAISPSGSQFLPQSQWFPAPNTHLTIRGADTAPFRLTVNAPNVISSGVEKSNSNSSVFEQAMNAQPFFVQGDWDRVEGAGDSRNITTLVSRGATAEEKKQAEALMAVAANARSYFAGLLGPAPDVPVRLISVRRGSGFSDGGAILIESGALRRAKPDASTVLLIGEAIARLWVGGQTAVRGDGGGVLRDGLARYLANTFIEKQFGPEAAREELLRQRIAYSSVSRKDAPISRVTPLDATYHSSVPNKGAMVWRLIENTIGRDVMLTLMREQLQAGKGNPAGISLPAVRNALATRGGERVKTLIDQQMDQVTDLDLMVGLPQQRGAEWVSALRNVGSIDAVTSVRAVTATGEQLSVNVTVPARNFGEAVFKTNAKVTRVEIDPDKLYPQLDYGNDAMPRTRDLQEALVEANRTFGAQDFVKAEKVAREILSVAPHLQEANLILARALLGQGRLDEAEKLFHAALAEPLPAPTTFAWANVGLGEIALRKGQNAEAARRFNDAVRADAEYAASLAGRAGRIKAETAANTLQIDPAIRTFVGQLDQAITGGKQAELESRIVSGELVRFIGGVVGTQPEVWQTRVLRTEQIDLNTAAADVSLATKELGREQSGTAVLILSKATGAWKLMGIDLFEVR
ncbi:MAG TPA: tetratricopeptide repeat protein [Pyrinomonadaceae bacterium]|nr:tetratricopeptide repeat protein [Pyrinomonadaceae bacterium]